MAVPQKLLNFLENNGIKYETVSHKVVYTAFDKAATLRVKPNIIGKTLILKADRDLVMALIPGNKNLDKNKFKKVVNSWKKGQGQKSAKSIGFISEAIMKNKFKGVKIGAMPPFGSLFKMSAFVDGGLLKEKNILLNSGVYNSSIKISPKILEKLGMIKGSFSKKK
jgi:Ala-tRNA(Pro) deacylase